MPEPGPAASSTAVTDPTGASIPLISVSGLRVHFEGKRGRVHAVDGVDLEIGDGETLGLVGETGSGKSVTARSILRLVQMPPGVFAGGEVLFRPKRSCSSCSGSGCDRCGGHGRQAVICSACSGSGCQRCRQTGRETIDLMQASLKELRRIRGDRIAMIFQDPGKALNPALTIRQQVGEVFFQHRSHELLRAAGLEDEDHGAGRLLERSAKQQSRLSERALLTVPPWRSRRNRLRMAIDQAVGQALADTRIPSPRKIMASYPHELSGGMKQRVMIAQALACDPDLLIADEPTTALDVTVQARILDLISEMQERHHTAVLYISHDLSLIRQVCDRVAVLYAGQIAEVATVDELFARPLHPYSQGLLRAIPSDGQARGELSAIRGTVPELIDPPPACRFHTRCDFATELCGQRQPQLGERMYGDEPHLAACLAYDDPTELGVQRSALPILNRSDR